MAKYNVRWQRDGIRGLFFWGHIESGPEYGRLLGPGQNRIEHEDNPRQPTKTHINRRQPTSIDNIRSMASNALQVPVTSSSDAPSPASRSASASASRTGIVVFSGGSAANNLVDVFERVREANRTTLSYVIPISDNGGSTSEIIRVFGGPGTANRHVIPDRIRYRTKTRQTAADLTCAQQQELAMCARDS